MIGSVFRWLFLIFCVTSCSYGQSPKEIIDSFFKKIETDVGYLSDNYTHEEEEVLTFYKNGVPEKIERKTYVVEKREGDVHYKKLLLIDGQPLMGSEYRPREENISVNKTLFERYNFSFQGVELHNGEECWSFVFNSRPRLIERERKDRVLNNVSGRLLISKQSNSIRYFFAKLNKPVDYGLPSFTGARIYSAEVGIYFFDFEGHSAIVNIRVKFHFSVKALFIKVTERQGNMEITYKNYRKMNKRREQ
ncbi:MAG TPA: hypothetical protein VJH71_01020 [Candidatus Paceibacterota bacterium]